MAKANINADEPQVLYHNIKPSAGQLHHKIEKLRNKGEVCGNYFQKCCGKESYLADNL